MPVVLEPAALRIGPLVVPGTGPCHRCFELRRSQHDRQTRETAALYAAYDRDPQCGPRGYLPQQARTASGVATLMLQHADREAGHVVSLLRGGGVRRDRVIGRHGCPRCAAPLPRQDLRVLLNPETRSAAGGDGRAQPKEVIGVQ
ncbi:TOMM precursor leader peptide-binding protein [Streptomyces sp. NPDC058985]|uniref:TOMM precursor leader peptide-binding protein n=1 Tax=Streptomyces sp. NPDC058985 TaxID=3346684 RepID=UPI0036752C47